MAQFRYIALFSPTPKRLFAVADKLSPRAEMYPPNGLILEVPICYEQDTLNRLAHLVDRQTRIGGASTRTVAILAAQTRPGTIVPYGREKEFLAPLPVALLVDHAEVEQSVLTIFDNWGIRTIGELAALPRKSVVTRLGRQGSLLLRLACGEDTYCLESYRAEPEFRESRELEWTITLLEPLFFLMGGMLENLCSRLRTSGLAVESLRIQFRLSNRSNFEHDIKLAFPMLDSKVILSLVRLELQSHSPKSGIENIVIQAFPARPRVAQHSLLQPTTAHPEKLTRTIIRLKAIMGSENVGSPRVLDTHRSDAIRLKELEVEGSKVPSGIRTEPGARLSLRRLRPPKPTQLKAREILFCSGPWRSSGDWWMEGGNTDGWSRDEWDVELSNGGIYRVFWDYFAKQWFLEGVYD